MVSQLCPLFGRSLKGLTLARLSQDLVELRTFALGPGRCLVLVEQLLAGNRHRLGNGSVELLGQTAGRFLGTGIGDRNHLYMLYISAN